MSEVGDWFLQFVALWILLIIFIFLAPYLIVKTIQNRPVIEPLYNTTAECARIDKETAQISADLSRIVETANTKDGVSGGKLDELLKEQITKLSNNLEEKATVAINDAKTTLIQHAIKFLSDVLGYAIVLVTAIWYVIYGGVLLVRNGVNNYVALFNVIMNTEEKVEQK